MLADLTQGGPGMSANFAIDVRYYRLSEPLQPYFTALYAFEFDAGSGPAIEDWLHPEWSQMRFVWGASPRARVGPGALKEQWPFVASGPTSRSIHFKVGKGRSWGIGLQPAGWAKFADGPASAVADTTVDGSSHPAFALFAPIGRMLGPDEPGLDTFAARINAYLMQHIDRPSAAGDLVAACHDALRDPDVGTVAAWAERVGLELRSLERLCLRFFGFPPKMLLRRQRFLRSLSRFMLHDAGSWSSAMDGQYHDQAQFVRDFRAFMGMTPSEYAERPHPIIGRTMAQRMADHGIAPQTDLPTILRYGAAPPRES
jgi:AraC-like DNA-binding protein